MQLYKIYKNIDQSHLDQFMKEQTNISLVTFTKNTRPKIGIFNPLVEENKIYLHFARKDKQVKDLRENNKASLIFYEFVGQVPSYWVDEKYGGAATLFYRYVEIQAKAKLIEDSEGMIPILERMLKFAQPEGGYESLKDMSIYGNAYKSILVAEFELEEMIVKWKLGEALSFEKRKEILKKLDAERFI